MSVESGVWTAGAVSGRPLVVGHGGASEQRPPNTLAAFAAALDAGADAFETDLRLSADRVCLCHHDEAVMLPDGMRPVAELPFAIIRRHRPDIPTLEEALAIPLPVYLDVKPQAPDDIASILGAPEIRREPERFVVGVTSWAISVLVAELAPAVAQVALMADAPGLAAFAYARQGHWVRLHEARASVAEGAALRRLGMQVMVTCGAPRSPGAFDSATWPGLRELAPDALVVNDPARCRETVRAPAGERLVRAC